MDQWYSVSFCGDSDSDCDHCRICGRCYLWNCRFLKCEYGVLAGNSEFFCTEIQVGGNRHCAAGSSCDRFRAYRTSDRDE